MHEYNNKSLGHVVSELKEELKDFINVRYQMLTNELRDKTSSWRAAGMLFGVAALFGFVGFIALTMFLGFWIAALFAGQYALAIGFLIVGLLWAIIGGALFWMGYREYRAHGITPERTLRVLKQDQAWLQQEARTQL